MRRNIASTSSSSPKHHPNSNNDVLSTSSSSNNHAVVGLLFGQQQQQQQQKNLYHQRYCSWFRIVCQCIIYGIVLILLQLNYFYMTHNYHLISKDEYDVMVHHMNHSSHNNNKHKNNKNKGSKQQQQQQQQRRTIATKKGKTTTKTHPDTHSTTKNNLRDNEKNTNITTNNKVLALLYPPGLLGGYRNEVLRLLALLHHTSQQNEQRFHYIYLPSLLFTTQLDTNAVGNDVPWYPIPMSWLFDIDYWNVYAKQNPKKLPQLIATFPFKSDCWIQWKDSKNLFTIKNAKNPYYYSSSNHSYYYEIDIQSNNNNNNNEQQQQPSKSTIINHLQYGVLQEGGSFQPIQNVTFDAVVNSNSISVRTLPDYLPSIQHCTNPVGFGGGKKIGRLWNIYVNHIVPKIRRRITNTNSSTITDVATNPDQPNQNNNNNNNNDMYYDTDIHLYRALRPAKQWRDVAEQCITKYTATTTTGDSTTTTTTTTNNHIIALHARIELEMMGHRCGYTMEKNLTNILRYITNRFLRTTENNDIIGDSNNKHYTGLFVAVSRAGIETTSSGYYNKFKHYADDNLRTFNIITHHQRNEQQFQHQDNATVLHPLLQRIMKELPVFECGRNILNEYYTNNPTVPDHGSILESIINFHIAVQAKVFIGVQGSSYSTDVLTTRYYLGYGANNYYYTPQGIIPVENNGLPHPHKDCPSLAAQRNQQRQQQQRRNKQQSLPK